MQPRSWWRRWGWAILGVATLALGIGAATALFSVIQAVLLAPLPIPHPAQVLSLLESSRTATVLPVSYPDFLDWQSSNRVFSAIAAARPSDMALTHLGPPAFVAGLRVSGNYFSLLGVPPTLGRALSPADDAPGAPAVVVVSSRFWRRRLGSNPAWLGRTIELDGVARTLVGVMPPNLPLAAGPTRFWTPLGSFLAHHPKLNQRNSRTAMAVLARLRPGVTLAAAQSDLHSIAARLARRYPASNSGITVLASPLVASIAGEAQPVLWGLLAAVGLLLLLACANLANLLLARATRQRPEDALRAALGASPACLLRRRLRESFALGFAGAAAGCGIAFWILRAAPALLASLPRTHHVPLNLPVLAAALALAILTALLCGLVPALAAARVQPAAVLARADAGGIAGHRRLRALLVGTQLALALLLLVGAGLLLRSVARLEAVNPGFDPHGALSFVIGLPTSSYPVPAAQLAFFRQAQLKLAHLPGVIAAGGAFPLPFATGAIPLPVAIPGQPAPPQGQQPTADIANIAGHYFAAMGMHLLSGRAFAPSDAAHAAPVAIVDTAFVHHFWPALPLSAALGRQIEFAGSRREIVGVVAHVRESGLTPVAPPPEAYIPQAQAQLFTNVLFFVLRTRLADPLSLRPAAAAQIQSIDPNQPITEVQTMAARVNATLAQPRLVLALLLAFALLALVLAAVGVYSAVSFAVAQRRREIGLRMALGADRSQLLRLLLAQGMQPAWAGALAGLALVLAFGHLAAAFLPAVSSFDPLTLFAASALLLAVAALACWLPARRAARVDPLLALREP